jgi:hypothetical protein
MLQWISVELNQGHLAPTVTILTARLLKQCYELSLSKVVETETLYVTKTTICVFISKRTVLHF